MHRKRLVIIFPAYNEEHRIAPTFQKFHDFFSQGTYRHIFDTNYFIAINGSTDRTQTVVQELQGKYSRVLHFREWKEHLGKGGALHYAFSEVKGDYIGFVDADGSTAPEEFAKLLPHLVHCDAVVASRFLPGSLVQDRSSIMRKIASRLFMFCVRVMFFLPVRDTQCGAKVFHERALKEVLPLLRIHNMAFDVELLYALHRCGFRIKEVPTVWVADDVGSSLSSPWKIMKASCAMFFSLISIRLRKF